VTSDLSGRWQLNPVLSENAEAKLARLHSPSSGGHGPGRHGGQSAGPSAQMVALRDRLLNPAAWFVLAKDGDCVTLTENDGRVTTLTPNGEKAQVDGLSQWT
jgi:hypothetical protein